MSFKPKISIKIGGSSSQTPQTPGGMTPTPVSAGPKIRLSVGGASKPSTPSEVVPAQTPKTKAGRAPKPTAKAAANKNGKRAKDDSDNEDSILVKPRDIETINRASKKIKLSLGSATPKTPTVLKAKYKGRPPKRPLGEGYDSEASDREDDPVIEEEWVLRMIPGDDCDYLRQMIEERKIGIPRAQGGADISMKFFPPEGRRALVTIRGKHYAAAMVDLPCIIEGLKSWDKKGWFKSADICQMLLVFARVDREQEAQIVPLPKTIDPNTHQYPHGLTPPMRFAKRRFRKRISRTAIEAVEDAVEKLLEEDAKAVSTRYEMIDPEANSRAPSYGSPGVYENGYGQYSEDEDADADADGDLDDGGYFGQNHNHGNGEDIEPDDDLAADLEAAFAEVDEAATPSSNAIMDTPSQIVGNGEASEIDGQAEAEEDSGDDSLEDDDDDAEGEDDDGVDEDEKARLAQLQGAREDIVEMEKSLSNLQAQLATQTNPILKSRLKATVERMKTELQLKKAAIGEGEDD